MATDTDASFTCPCCGAVSRHPSDAEQGYCGRCHWWTGDPQLGPAHLESPCEAREHHAADDLTALTETLGLYDP